MRADCGLRRGGLSLVDGELEAAATAVESLRARAESAAAAGRAAQSALVASSTENNDVVGIGMRLSHARKLASAYPRTEPYTNLAGNDFVATLERETNPDYLADDANRYREAGPLTLLEPGPSIRKAYGWLAAVWKSTSDLGYSRRWRGTPEI